MSTAVKLVLAVAVVAGSFVLGALVARGLRMPDYSFKIGLVLFTLIASMVVNIAGWPPKRGIDLSGGVVLIYEVEHNQAKPDWMGTAVARINGLLNVEGGEKLAAKPVSPTRSRSSCRQAPTSRVQTAMARLYNNPELDVRSDGKREEDGKTVLVYRVSAGQQKTVNMDKLIAAVGKRINPSGVKELTIRRSAPSRWKSSFPRSSSAKSNRSSARSAPAVCSNSTLWPTKSTTAI